MSRGTKDSTDVSLETLAACDTLPNDPTQTVAPGIGLVDTAGRGALRALEQLENVSRGEQLSVGDTLGEGGMGIVYSATQRALGRKVAVKTVKPSVRTKEATLSLLQEAWITGSLEHPNVVPVYNISFGPANEPQIVLKHIEGVTWMDLMHSPDRVLERFGAEDMLEWNLGIFRQVINAVRFAHSRHIVHRDIKPANVMVGGFGEVYVLDWGLAVGLRDDGSGRIPVASRKLELAGTPAYMAPEMLGAQGSSISERTDVYLLGSVLYEVICGAPPHDADSLGKVLESVAASDPKFPADAPEGLVQICRRAMAREPDARFDAVEELGAAVVAFLEHRGSTALSETAENQLAELRTSLAREGDCHDVGGRSTIYNLYGACRFGFQAALSTWPGNTRASKGLTRAVTVMARYELSHGDHRAATTLLGQLDEPPGQLIREVAEARLQSELDEQRRQRLERDASVVIGQRTRLLFILVFGSLWALLPLLSLGQSAQQTNYVQMGAVTGITIMLIVGFGVWARESLSRTAVNRRVYGAVLCAPIGTAISSAAAYWAGFEPLQLTLMQMSVWAGLALMFSLTIELRAWPTAVSFAAALFVTAKSPELRVHAMVLSNVVLIVNATYVWWPGLDVLKRTAPRKRCR